jgi:hypothetical protein
MRQRRVKLSDRHGLQWVCRHSKRLGQSLKAENPAWCWSRDWVDKRALDCNMAASFKDSRSKANDHR